MILSLALAVLAAGPARADEHPVREGETLARIAQLYYGDAPAGLVAIAEANRISDPEETVLVPGQRLYVPVPERATVQPGESWERLAERTLGHAGRGGVLARANAMDPAAAPDAGVEVVVPVVVAHRTDRGDTLPAISKRYYGGTKGLRLLREFNDLRAGARPVPDGTILVPFPDLRLTEAGAELLARVARDRDGDGARTRAQAEIAQALPGLEDLWREGRYVELVAAANRLAGRPEATGNQLVTIGRWLAFAYVALEREDLAEQALRATLEHQPDLELNPITTSPKILRVLRAARRAREVAPAPDSR
jgi:LysM repeat protein